MSLPDYRKAVKTVRDFPAAAWRKVPPDARLEAAIAQANTLWSALSAIEQTEYLVERGAKNASAAVDVVIEDTEEV